MNRCLLACGWLGLCFAPLAAPGQPERPNVVLIMADDMGFSDIGCYGSEIPTPELDRLALEGLRFSQFYNTGRCCPTRASLLTGLYPHQTGLGHMTKDHGLPAYRGYLNERCVTIAEALEPAGYRSYMVGKWHVGSERGHWPTDRGFDRFYGSNTSTGHYFGLNEDQHDRRLLLDDREVEPGEDWYATDAYTGHALRFIDEHDAEAGPFFLYVAYTAPHWPLHAKAEDIARHRGRYDEGWDALRRARFERLRELGLLGEEARLSPRDPEVPAWEEAPDREVLVQLMEVYAAMIDCMDRNIGRLIDKLESRGMAENTLVLFLSDNGGCAEGGLDGFRGGEKGATIGSPQSYDSCGIGWSNASNTPFRLHKKWVHEGGIATPLIAWWPQGIARAGEVERQPRHVIDVMATVLDLAGARYPERREGREITPLEGKSLRALFEGEPGAGHEALFFEHEGNRAVREGDWKLVADGIDGGWELYDLAKDRCELEDLAGEEPERVETMAARWEAWAKRTGVVPFPEARSWR